MEPSQVWQIMILIILLILSGFFSMSETALTSLSKIRIRHMVEEKVKGAKLVEKLTEDPNKLLGAILIGNNIVNIAASALATTIFVDIFGASGVGIATAVMTVLVLIFGEITPKSIAKQKSEQVSLKVSKPISIIVKVFKPFIGIFTFISSGFIRLLGGDPKANEPFITEEELKTMVGVSEEEGVLEDVEKEMIFNVFDFADAQVKDVMVQRVDIIAVDIDASYEEVLETIKTEQFSRIPVYNQTIDDIVGVLNVKDLIIAGQNKEGFKVSDYMREPHYTFEFKKIKELFNEMKKSRNHMSVVLDEYGGTVGIVTIEDLIEEVFGDIEDEYDDYNEEIEVVKEDEYIVDGSARLDDISDLIGVNMESEEFDSVGGLIIGELGRFPDNKEEVNLNNIRFVVEEIDKNRIRKVRIYT
ncbi:HlyC/CorC family transporter [Clostridium celatum]|uniref:HlyC/CorC family transporter n=1 Tax=Clostridium celatum TaxID=36834 RepID=UPI00058C8CDA|nr:hemolysin family protein [Clostridium celatum]MCE9656206.1 hemolysin family protein [Clostridium celatum]MDU2265847.1 hemolysin family protein [Clostridium celatum]MDU6297103.1 hemolysin family protein [Clostridium celatum]MDY3359734.1 hemolysin family protein [Clostridium celatum]